MAWNINPSLFADVITRVAVEHQKDIATDMLTALVDKHPTDTTRFVSNLNVSIGSADDSYDDSKFVGRGGALSAGMSVINGLSTTELKSIYFVNTTPYGKYLEGGWSRQAINGVFLPAFLGVSMWYK